MFESNTSRRKFLASAAAVTASVLALPVMRAAAQDTTGSAAASDPSGPKGPHILPPLAYPANALEPHIDAKTMEIHHGKHHATYVSKLNEAIAGKDALDSKKADELIMDLASVPEDIRMAVRNNAGGHVNHTMFWDIMTPGGAKEPSGKLAEAIDEAFDSFDKFKKAFNQAGEKRFGSGWVWLLMPKGGGKLQIVSTPNQDNPMMEGHDPILGNDVWEHAYYLKYQNKRPEYLEAWWNVVNWDKVAGKFSKAG